MKNNWLITGGCGFIGTRLIRALLEHKEVNVCVLDDLSVGSRSDLGTAAKFEEVSTDGFGSIFETECSSTRCQLVVGDILDAELAMSVSRKADVIVHLAANTGVGPSVENPRHDCLTNVVGTLNYLEAARGNSCGRFIFASSGAPLGEVETPPIHEQLPANPVSPYGASKLAGEGYCSAYHGSYGLNTVSLRFGNVYGPGSLHKSSVVAKFIKAAFDGEALTIFGDGAQTRDFIYIDDLIAAILAASKARNVGGEKFQIATSRESTVSEITMLLLDILEDRGIGLPELIYESAKAGDVKRNFSDVSKAKSLLNWQPEYELREGLEKTVDYFLTMRKVNA